MIAGQPLEEKTGQGPAVSPGDTGRPDRKPRVQTVEIVGQSR
jgi:hypothetical protein